MTVQPSAPLLAATLILTLAGGQTHAQVRTAAQIEAGYGASAQVMDQAFDPSTRDERGNRVVLDGLIQSGAGNSGVLLNGQGPLAGAQYFQSGATTMSASAIGNLVSIDVSGNWNTIVLNSSQVNYGDQNAVAVLNGQSVASTSPGAEAAPSAGQ